MKKAKCYKCQKILSFTNNIGGSSEFVHDERDFDGMDIFLCGCFRGHRFKLDMKHYLKNRNQNNFIAKTLSADLDFSDGYDKKPKKINRSIVKKVKNLLGF